MRRYVFVDFLKFFFSIAVALHHFRMFDTKFPFGGGYLAVDFFLVMSGFFGADSLKRNLEKSFFVFVTKRYLRLFWEYLIAELFAFGVCVAFCLNYLSGSALGYILELFMIELWHNDCSYRLIPAGWYCGYLLLSTVIVSIIYLLTKERKMFCFLFFSLIGYLSLFLKYNSLCIYPNKAGFLDFDTLVRCLSGLSLGMFLSCANKGEKAEKLRTINVSVGCICFVVLAYGVLWSKGFTRFDYLKLIVFVLLFWIVIKCDIHICDGGERIINYLGEISYTVFLCHFAIVRCFVNYRQMLNDIDWKLISLLYLVVVCVISVSAFTFYKVMKKYMNILWVKKK